MPHGGHDHEHGHARHHHDLNLRSAYLHVVADAATSVLAIVALVGGGYFGASWLDPVMGIVGHAAGRPLGTRTAARYRARAARCGDGRAGGRGGPRGRGRRCREPARLRDLHVWRVGKGKYACIVSLETERRR